MQAIPINFFCGSVAHDVTLPYFLFVCFSNPPSPSQGGSKFAGKVDQFSWELTKEMAVYWEAMILLMIVGFLDPVITQQVSQSTGSECGTGVLHTTVHHIVVKCLCGGFDIRNHILMGNSCFIPHFDLYKVDSDLNKIQFNLYK